MTVSRGNFNRPTQLSPVRVVATSNISGTYSNGPVNNGVQAQLATTASTLTVDSVAVALGDSVLLSGQSSAFQNGIYFYQSLNSSGNVVLQRRDDFQAAAQMKPGFFVNVGAGTINNGAVYTMVEPQPVNIGTDSIVWAAASAETGGGNVTAGSNGVAGAFISYPSTVNSGVLELAAANSSGNFTNIITNASMGQATTWTLGDPGAAASKVLQASGSLVNNHLLAANGTAGNTVDTGYVYPAADVSANADATTIAGTLSSNGSKVLSFSNVLPRYATGSLTLAQFNAMYTTPIEVIPAPGAGLMVQVILFSVEWVFGSAAPTSGGAVYLEYGNTAHGTNYASPVGGMPAAFFTGVAANSAINALGQINATSGLATSVCGNAAINITNATGVFATGTGGSLNWYVLYNIVPIS